MIFFNKLKIFLFRYLLVTTILVITMIFAFLLLCWCYCFNYESIFNRILEFKNFIILKEFNFFTSFSIVHCMDSEDLINETTQNSESQVKSSTLSVNIPSITPDVPIADKLSAIPTLNIQHPLDLSVKLGTTVKVEMTDAALAATILAGGATLVYKLPKSSRAGGVAATLGSTVISTTAGNYIRSRNQKEVLESHQEHVERMRKLEMEQNNNAGESSKINQQRNDKGVPEENIESSNASVDSIKSPLEPYLFELEKYFEKLGLYMHPQGSPLDEIKSMAHWIDFTSIFSGGLLIFYIVSSKKIYVFFMQKFPFPSFKPWFEKVMLIRRLSNTFWRYVILVAVIANMYYIHVFAFLISESVDWIKRRLEVDN